MANKTEFKAHNDSQEIKKSQNLPFQNFNCTPELACFLLEFYKTGLAFVLMKTSELQLQRKKNLIFNFIVETEDSKAKVSIHGDQKVKEILDKVTLKGHKSEYELWLYGSRIDGDKKVEEYKLDDDFVFVPKKKSYVGIKEKTFQGSSKDEKKERK